MSESGGLYHLDPNRIGESVVFPLGFLCYVQMLYYCFVLFFVMAPPLPLHVHLDTVYLLAVSCRFDSFSLPSLDACM